MRLWSPKDFLIYSDHKQTRSEATMRSLKTAPQHHDPETLRGRHSQGFKWIATWMSRQETPSKWTSSTYKALSRALEVWRQLWGSLHSLQQSGRRIRQDCGIWGRRPVLLWRYCVHSHASTWAAKGWESEKLHVRYPILVSLEVVSNLKAAETRTCVPIAVLGSEGYLPANQLSIERLALITSGLCAEEFVFLDYFLTSLKWICPRWREEFLTLMDVLKHNST